MNNVKDRGQTLTGIWAKDGWRRCRARC